MSKLETINTILAQKPSQFVNNRAGVSEGKQIKANRHLHMRSDRAVHVARLRGDQAILLEEEHLLQALLELLVLRRVDDRVDAAVREHGDNAEVIIVAVQRPEVEHSEVEEEEEPLVPADAQYEGGAHHCQSLYHVHLRPGFGRAYLSVLSLAVGVR